MWQTAETHRRTKLLSKVWFSILNTHSWRRGWWQSQSRAELDCPPPRYGSAWRPVSYPGPRSAWSGRAASCRGATCWSAAGGRCRWSRRPSHGAARWGESHWRAASPEPNPPEEEAQRRNPQLVPSYLPGVLFGNVQVRCWDLGFINTPLLTSFEELCQRAEGCVWSTAALRELNVTSLVCIETNGPFVVAEVRKAQKPAALIVVELFIRDHFDKNPDNNIS